MSKYDELQAQIDELTRLLGERGIALPEKLVIKPEDRKDYVPFGSPAHAAFLGLIEVDDVKSAEELGFIVYESPKTPGKFYRLEDQVTPFMHYPDPMQVARLVLLQKVSEFESPPPEPSPDAPSMWQAPVEMPI